MLSFIFTYLIVLSIIAWIFDWEGNRASKRYMKRYYNDLEVYKDPDYFFNDDDTPSAPETLPKVLVVIAVLFPVLLPFMIAHRNRKERPVLSITMYVLWSLVCALTALLCVVYFTS